MPPWQGHALRRRSNKTSLAITGCGNDDEVKRAIWAIYEELEWIISTSHTNWLAAG
jgi:hypothetical protein